MRQSHREVGIGIAGVVLLLVACGDSGTGGSGASASGGGGTGGTVEGGGSPPVAGGGGAGTGAASAGGAPIGGAGTGGQPDGCAINKAVPCDPTLADQCLCTGCDFDACFDTATNTSVDCVCPVCAKDEFCSDKANCTDGDGCDPVIEGCQCADCADHPACAG
ncbi:MAG: hypothetical protein HOW73_26450 [Polyangiaceae bacterium]|nr:hypothetical protein [Polyangiaceae bacterium]